MKYLKYFESIDNTYSLLDLIDIGYDIREDSKERIVLYREVFYEEELKCYYNEFDTVSNYLDFKSTNEGRWEIKIDNIIKDGNYNSYYFNNVLRDKDYILPDRPMGLLEISIDCAIRLMNDNNLEFLDLNLRSLPKGFDKNFKVDETISFIFK